MDKDQVLLAQMLESWKDIQIPTEILDSKCLGFRLVEMIVRRSGGDIDFKSSEDALLTEVIIRIPKTSFWGRKS